MGKGETENDCNIRMAYSYAHAHVATDEWMYIHLKFLYKLNIVLQM